MFLYIILFLFYALLKNNNASNESMCKFDTIFKFAGFIFDYTLFAIDAYFDYDFGTYIIALITILSFLNLIIGLFIFIVKYNKELIK